MLRVLAQLTHECGLLARVGVIRVRAKVSSKSKATDAGLLQYPHLAVDLPPTPTRLSTHPINTPTRLSHTLLTQPNDLAYQFIAFY